MSLHIHSNRPAIESKEKRLAVKALLKWEARKKPAEEDRNKEAFYSATSNAIMITFFFLPSSHTELALKVNSAEKIQLRAQKTWPTGRRFIRFWRNEVCTILKFKLRIRDPPGPKLTLP